MSIHLLYRKIKFNDKWRLFDQFYKNEGIYKENKNMSIRYEC